MSLQWDRNFALEQAGDDEELLTELLDLLRISSAGDLEKAKNAIAAGVAEAMADAANSIKGAAASMGLVALSAVAYEIERKGRGGDLGGGAGHIAELQGMIAELDSLA